ncbi:MAG: peptide-methionine (R)-S-oxide reductase MsrB [Actinomycetota bacterium]
MPDDRIEKTEEQWRAQLGPDRYRVLREKGTERAFTGHLLENKEKGTYVCGACGNELFASDTKFESGTGWPSFTDPVNSRNVKLEHDHSHFMHRIEVICARCDSHLGHVFDDGPGDSGKRYCINSCSLDFSPETKA